MVAQKGQKAVFAETGLGGDGGEDSGGEPKGGGLKWAGWEARCAADSQFVYKVCVEQFIGVTSAVVGDMSTRPYWVTPPPIHHLHYWLWPFTPSCGDADGP